MDIDEDKIDDTALALLWQTLHNERCGWKGFDWRRRIGVREGYDRRPGEPLSNPTRRAFGRIVRQAGAAIVEEAGKGSPALQHVVERLGLINATGQFKSEPS